MIINSANLFGEFIFVRRGRTKNLRPKHTNRQERIGAADLSLSTALLSDRDRIEKFIGAQSCRSRTMQYTDRTKRCRLISHLNITRHHATLLNCNRRCVAGDRRRTPTTKTLKYLRSWHTRDAFIKKTSHAKISHIHKIVKNDIKVILSWCRKQSTTRPNCSKKYWYWEWCDQERLATPKNCIVLRPNLQDMEVIRFGQCLVVSKVKWSNQN